MKYGRRSRTNAQHAPASGRMSEARQASRSAPLQVASMMRNLSSGGTTHTIIRMTRIVIMMLNGPDSRLARTQPSAPVMAIGGGSASIGMLRTKPGCLKSVAVMTRASPFHQRHAAVVPVHRQRSDEADGEVDRHGDRDHLDRLAGLIEHGPGEYLHQVGIADEHRERGVLREIEILARERRGGGRPRPGGERGAPG